MPKKGPPNPNDRDQRSFYGGELQQKKTGVNGDEGRKTKGKNIDKKNTQFPQGATEKTLRSAQLTRRERNQGLKKISSGKRI